MLSNINLWFINQKNFFKMSKFIIMTISLLIITWVFDIKYPYLKLHIPEQMLLSSEVSVNFLSNISGVFLTISIFSFTTIITVLNYYSSNISPRMIQSFIDKTGVLSLFGIFIGGFFYSVLTILLLRETNLEQKVLAGSIGIGYSIITMIGFIMFSKQVLENIKISNIIEAEYNECEELIDTEIEQREKAYRYENDDCMVEIPILAQKTGYIYKIKAANILGILKDQKAELVTAKRVGQYTVEGELLATLQIFDSSNIDQLQKKDLAKEISQAIVINIFNNNEENYHRGLINLTEIASMALSPGTNDPNSAITCINKISFLLGKLLSADNHFIILDENEESKIIYQNYSVEEELYFAFIQIIHYSAGDPLVTTAILQGLYTIYVMAGDNSKTKVKDFFNASYDLLIANFSDEIHISKFRHIRENIDQEISHNQEKNYRQSFISNNSDKARN